MWCLLFGRTGMLGAFVPSAVSEVVSAGRVVVAAVPEVAAAGRVVVAAAPFASA